MSAIAQQATEIVADNGLQGQVTILQAKIEDVELPVAQVYITFVIYQSIHVQTG